MPQCLSCLQQYPTKIEIDGKVKVLSNRRKYCLNCSPLNGHNTKVLDKKNDRPDCRKCPKCEVIKPIKQFYPNNTKTNKIVSYCRVCMLEHTIKRQTEFKQKCVDYKGGKCKRCGYNRCLSALEFHHRDTITKEFTLSNMRLTSFDKNYDTIIKELDKCDLLCANCHREEHVLILSNRSVPTKGVAPL